MHNEIMVMELIEFIPEIGFDTMGSKSTLGIGSFRALYIYSGYDVF